MDESPRTRRALVFGGVAEIYERSRPGYPDEAVRWLVGRGAGTILELGAGTGKLTSSLVADGHRVVATDPEARMLKPLRKRLKGVKGVNLVQACAEQIPVRSYSVDAVVVAHAFHWFDHDLALREIARVLRPGGTLALVWNLRDETVPWVRRLGRIIGSERTPDPTEMLEESTLFDGVEERSFRHWQEVDRDGLVDLVHSRSGVADMPEQERDDVLDQVGELYDDYGRGHDGMLLPYHCRTYRCRVSATAHPRGAQRSRDQHGPLDDGLLIDFS